MPGSYLDFLFARTIWNYIVLEVEGLCWSKVPFFYTFCYTNFIFEKRKMIMGYITTYTGKKINPLEPNMEALDVRDIAHALSLTCRGNGHVKQFFSVGQHCISCAKEAAARGYSNRVVLACLLHDASEVYMSDVPRPFKVVLTEYVEAEERLLGLIYEHFLGSVLSEEEQELVRKVDDDLLYYDMKELLGVNIEMDAPILGTQMDYSVRAFADVEQEYLDMYEQWKVF